MMWGSFPNPGHKCLSIFNCFPICSSVMITVLNQKKKMKQNAPSGDISIHLDSLTCSDVHLPPCIVFPFLLVFPLTQDWKDMMCLKCAPTWIPRRQNSPCTQNVGMKFTFKAFQVPTIESSIDIVWVSSHICSKVWDRFNIFLYLAWKITTLSTQATQCQSNKLETQMVDTLNVEEALWKLHLQFYLHCLTDTVYRKHG